MDRATRSELLKTIDSQKDQIDRYQTRLRDLILAYKSLTKEKEALEATVQALGVSHDHEPSAKKDDRSVASAKSDSTKGEPQENIVDVDHPLREDKSEGSGTTDELKHLRNQLSTLTSSLSTVMQEKHKMQVNYMAEKKQLRHEYDEAVVKFDAEREKMNDMVDQLRSQVSELRNRLRTQQHEREKEQNDHAIMIKELQKLLSDERIAKEHVEHQFDEAQQIISETQTARGETDQLQKEYERKLRDLSNELEAVRQRLRDTEDNAAKPSPLLLQLQKEMAEMKAQARISVQQEQTRANVAEEKMRHVAQHGEERICTLETKLSELSSVVGNYEKLRKQDEVSIHRLRDRVAQLDMENTALARAANKTNDQDNTNEDSNLDVQALIDKITALKGMLKLANERSETPLNLEELLQHTSLEENDRDIHRKCNEDYRQLKEEFERYKLRAQSVLKTKSSKESSTNSETDLLKSQNSELREKIISMQLHFDDIDAEQKQTIDDLRLSIAAMHEKHQQALAACDTSYKQRASELEQHLHKHRDRTIALLIEKDREIERLRAMCAEPFEYTQSTRSGDDEDKGDRSDEASTVSQLISNGSSFNAPAEGSILHYAQEQARMKVEISTLRKAKHSLESAMREMQQSVSMKEEKYQDQIDFLKEEVRKYERNQSRESANLEYLKNVVLQYMICHEIHGKQHMLNAIAIILQFSPKEKESVQHSLNKWWSTTYSSSAVGGKSSRRK